MPHSLIPAVLLRQGGAEDFIHRIADLKVEAKARGYATLAYFLDIAECEAMIQADNEASKGRARRHTGRTALPGR